MYVIINNLTKIVEEWKAEKECRDTKQNFDFEIELSRSCEKCDEKLATEVDLNVHIGKKHRKVFIQVEPASLNNDETKPTNEKLLDVKDVVKRLNRKAVFKNTSTSLRCMWKTISQHYCHNPNSTSTQLKS